MTDFTQQNNFRNSFDIKSLVVESAYRGVIDDSRVDNMLKDIKAQQKLVTAIERISNALCQLDGLSELLNDYSLEYSYTDISKAVGLLEKCYQFAKEERERIQ